MIMARVTPLPSQCSPETLTSADMPDSGPGAAPSLTLGPGPHKMRGGWCQGVITRSETSGRVFLCCQSQSIILMESRLPRPQTIRSPGLGNSQLGGCPHPPLTLMVTSHLSQSVISEISDRLSRVMDLTRIVIAAIVTHTAAPGQVCVIMACCQQPGAQDVGQNCFRGKF